MHVCVNCCLFFSAVGTGSVDWCQLDTGPMMFRDTKSEGDVEFGAYVSRTRDGSVWLRFGPDGRSLDWTYVDERRRRYHTPILDPADVYALSRLNYSASCVLTDVRMSVVAVASWHPTFVVAFDPAERRTAVILMRHSQDCAAATEFRLSADRQAIRCDGAERHHACGQRNLPERGTRTRTLFLKDVNFDPEGQDSWQCPDNVEQQRSSYTFTGSYYHVYVQLAKCGPQTGSSFCGDLFCRLSSMNLYCQLLSFAVTVAVSHYFQLLTKKSAVLRRRQRELPTNFRQEIIFHAITFT